MGEIYDNLLALDLIKLVACIFACSLDSLVDLSEKSFSVRCDITGKLVALLFRRLDGVQSFKERAFSAVIVSVFGKSPGIDV